MTQTAQFTHTFFRHFGTCAIDSNMMEVLSFHAICWNVKCQHHSKIAAGKFWIKAKRHCLYQKEPTTFSISRQQWSLSSPRSTLYQINKMQHTNQGEAAHFLCFWKIFWRWAPSRLRMPTTLCSTITNLWLTSCQDHTTSKNHYHHHH